MKEFNSQRAPDLHYAINNEVNSILTDITFRRSPVLSKLLRFLANETINGNHHKLKSYTIAVDVLGRLESFDPTTDSSARVQMARLRKALESYYSHHGPAEDHCLYLQPGSFKVRLGKLIEAYPALYQPLLSVKAQAKEAEPASFVATAPNVSSPTTDLPSIGLFTKWFRSLRTIRTPMFAALLCVLLSTAIWYVWANGGVATTEPQSPVLELLPVENADKPEHIEDARLVATSLADDMPRFRASRVRLIKTEADSRPPAAGEHVYRLATRIEASAAGEKILFIRLIEASTDVALWSHQIRFGNLDELEKSIFSLSGEINGFHGIVTRFEQISYRNNYSSGYACMLQYIDFSENRREENEQRISRCLKQTTKEKNLQSTALAARAMFTIDKSSAQQNFESAIIEAEGYAREAVATNPEDAVANFALARLSYFKNDCVSARFYTDRTIEINPKNILLLSHLAAMAPLCNYAKAHELLDKAVMAQSPNYPKGRLLLAISAYLLSRPEVYDEIQASDIPQSRSGRINYYLTEALIAAAKGQRRLAARNWQRFAIMQPPQNRPADDLLKPLITTAPTRRQIIAFLEESGAFER